MTNSGAGSQVQAAKEEAAERAHDLTATAADHVGAVKEEVKGKALDLAHDVRRELETQGDVQAKRLASNLHDVGAQIRNMADAGQPGAVTDVTRQIADKSQAIGERLETGGMAGLGDDLRTFARRQPGLFLAAAGLAGFVVTRVLRNASQMSGESTSTLRPSAQASTASPSSLPASSPSSVDMPLAAGPPPGSPR